MGKVRMIESPHIPGVYAVETDVDFVYCDVCGSFDLETRIGTVSAARFAMRIVGGGIIILSLFRFLTVTGNGQELAVACVGAISGAIALLVSMPPGHLHCRRCGNERITDNNVLHYAENNDSVLDIPPDFIVKHYHGSRVF